MIYLRRRQYFSISTSLQARFAIQRENNYKKTNTIHKAFDPTIVWYFGEFDEKITESAL
jgi:hypothetical protein